jgi:hypothetical protein
MGGKIDNLSFVGKSSDGAVFEMNVERDDALKELR